MATRPIAEMLSLGGGGGVALAVAAKKRSEVPRVPVREEQRASSVHDSDLRLDVCRLVSRASVCAVEEVDGENRYRNRNRNRTRENRSRPRALSVCAMSAVSSKLRVEVPHVGTVGRYHL